MYDFVCIIQFRTFWKFPPLNKDRIWLKVKEKYVTYTVMKLLEAEACL